MSPDGAIRPGATGTTQGPFAIHVVPTCPIIQLAAGIVNANRIRKITPSRRRCCSLSDVMPLPSTWQIPSARSRRRDIRRSRNPRRAGARGRRDSRCGSRRVRSARSAAHRRPPVANAKVAALSIHISGVWMTKRRSMPRRQRKRDCLDGVARAPGIAEKSAPHMPASGTDGPSI